ncbi:Carbon-nitrogen hydrolase [Phlyctochytrium planicorne]|nr:Carbon-nitrogen hydrolase [Phlyctochytrium planicorne]
MIEAQRLRPGDLDILILPEMAFSGYVFNDKDDIREYVEDPHDGPTVTWAKETAMRLQCFVQVGFPRCSLDQPWDSTSPPEPWYNSVCLVDRGGRLVDLYDKHFLYTTDENWAAEGEAFKAITVKKLDGNADVKLGFAICMDLNPYRFETSFTAYEFSNYQRHQGAKFISGSMAWLLSDDGDMDEYVQPADPSMSTLEYWVMRLAPLRLATRGRGKEGKIIVAICNRIGLENGSRFCGSSTVLKLEEGEVEILNVAGFNNETIIVANADS